ncbi:hypothetical protein [Streptomyces sp. NPDC046759]|uniref:hypothetical protein n=1 Tax=Streptomyces sp. NPDC046759 TaxID=3155019 RepID=UPI0033CED447
MEAAGVRPPLRSFAVRAVFAALPVVSFGLLCPLPSLVLALLRGARTDWWAFGAFSAVLAAWVAELELTPDTTHGPVFAADVALILLSVVGASLHAWNAWKAWPRRTDPS